MILNEGIDLRLFLQHWKHTFMVEKETATGLDRSVPVFDAAGDAVHNFVLRADPDILA